jgi:hypothetical protein
MPDWDEPISCHAICRAFVRYFPFECADGFFDANKHSWLHADWVPDVVVDLYPVGGVAPSMFYTGSSFLPWRRLYWETLIEFDMDLCARQTENISTFLEERLS